MKIIKKYTAIELSTTTINDEVFATLSHGKISGPYYDVTHPQEEFDTEQEAIEYAFKTDRYKNWLIVPIIKFDRFED